ncbi:MAG: CBS domain-containing protein [Deltaproteobacteria bacterium]|nr:CBS domain-containing protein [Deltaproteobacteria bacterium]
MQASTPKLVGDLMTKEVVTLDRNEQLSIADQVMSLGRIRHLPVLGEEGELVGIVSRSDLLHGALASMLGYGSRGRQKLMNTILVKEVMTNGPTVVAPDTPLGEAARIMSTNKIGCLPVTRDDQLVGILTEGDFVELHAAESES